MVKEFCENTSKIVSEDVIEDISKDRCVDDKEDVNVEVIQEEMKMSLMM